MQSTHPGEVTTLLQQVSKGDCDAAGKLIPFVPDELRQVASLQLQREKPNHTLQPAALVNEAFIRLVGDQIWGASVMRRILVDPARRPHAQKRGGASAAPADLEQIPVISDGHELQKMSPRQDRIVELRRFCGLSVEETAEVLTSQPLR